jgi:hypothetical protein
LGFQKDILFAGNVWISMIIEFMIIMMLIAFALSYKEVMKIIEMKIVPSDQGFLNGPMHLSSKMEKGMKRPLVLLLIAIVIGILLGCGSVIAISISGGNDTSEKNVNADDDLEPHNAIFERENLIKEGASIDESIRIGAWARGIIISGSWEDEPDETLCTNMPDRFRISLSYSLVSGEVINLEDEGENPSGQRGSVEIKCNLGEDQEIKDHKIMVEVSLIEAGDQEGICGFGLISSIDDSNTISYSIILNE